jgi:hypothetical protein
MPPVTAFGPIPAPLVDAWMILTGLPADLRPALEHAFSAMYLGADADADADAAEDGIAAYTAKPAVLLPHSAGAAASAAGAGTKLTLSSWVHPAVAAVLSGVALPGTGNRAADVDRWRLAQMGPAGMLVRARVSVGVVWGDDGDEEDAGSVPLAWEVEGREDRKKRK